MANTKNAEKAMRDQRRRLQSRTPHRMYSYEPFQRLIDSQQGRATARTSSCEDINDTPLVQRLCWTYTESVNRLFAQTQVVNHATIKNLEQNVRRLEDLQCVIVALEAELAGWPEPDLTAHGGGEEHLSPEAIRTRRQRDADIDKARPLSRLAQNKASLEVLQADCHADAAVLVEQYDLMRAAEQKLRAYTHRRAANYGRAWDALREDTAGRVEIPVPEWAQGQCPWLPTTYDQVMASRQNHNESEEQK